MKKHIRIGSRDSELAVAQTQLVIRGILNFHPEIEVELVTMKTTGDLIVDRRLDQIGGKGLFVKELDRALLEGRIDLSVHSLKDLPADISEEIPLIGFLKRGDPRDCLIYKERFHGKCQEIPEEKEKLVIGSSSQRRILQLQRLYPHARFETIRGNVQTRMRKLEEQDFSAICLAMAGMKRLGMEERVDRIFSVDEIIPAPGQGILAIQGRKGQDYEFLKEICDKDAAIAAAAERAFTKALEGGCSSPTAAYAEIKEDGFTLTGLYYSEETKKCIIGKRQVPLIPKQEILQAEEAGKELAEELKKGQSCEFSL